MAAVTFSVISSSMGATTMRLDSPSTRHGQGLVRETCGYRYRLGTALTAVSATIGYVAVQALNL